MTKWITFISMMLLSLSLGAQGFTYSYMDPCTKTYKTVTIPQNQQGIVVNYYGNINTFTANDFNNGNFDLWITQVSQANSSSPCDEITTAIQTNTNTIITQNIVSTLTNITSAAATVSQTLSGGMSNALGNTTNNSSESSGGRKGNKSNNSTNNGTNTTNNTSNGNISSSSSSTNGNTQSSTNSGTSSGTSGSGNSQGETNNQNGGNTGNTTNSSQNGGGQTQSSVNNNSGNNSGTSTGNTGGNGGNSNNGGGNTGNTGGNGGNSNNNGNSRGGNNGGSGGNVDNTNGNTNNGTTEESSGGNGGTTNSISNAAENTSSEGSGSKGGSRARVGSLIGTGDLVAIRSTDRDEGDQLKATMSFTKTNTNNTRAKGLLGNFTTNINNSNLTFYSAYTKKRNTLIMANSSMIDFQRNFFNTSTVMESYRFNKFSLMGGANYTIGGVGKGSFQNLSAVGGGFFMTSIGKKMRVTTLVLAVYSPYTLFYEGKWWNSSTLIVPFSSWDYSITKTFKFNVSFSGTYEVNQNFLNYQILTGGKILFY